MPADCGEGVRKRDGRSVASCAVLGGIEGASMGQRLVAFCAVTALIASGGCGGSGGGGGGSPPPGGGLPTLQVLSPNGGESWRTSLRATVTWTPGAVGGPVDVDLSLDGGLGWGTMAASVADVGSVEVEVPPWLTSAARVRVSPADGNPDV